MRKGPIVIIDDDNDDCELLIEAIHSSGYKNEVRTFSDPDEAFSGLCDLIKHATPFVILCDINLPRVSGIELKQRIDKDKDLRSKSIPFVFLSTAGDGHFVDKAYQCCTVQGFFVKESRLADLTKNLQLILDYWTVAKTPDK